MTTDELKKEAEECMHNALYWLKLPISKENVEQGGSYILKLLEPREKRIEELIDLIHAERKRQEQCDDIHLRKIAELEAEVKEWKDKADLWCKTANLKDHNIMINKELEKENAELKEELKKWKDEWQEQVQKATDEGYARTLQTIQLTKAKELLERLLITSCNSDVLNLLPNCSEVLRVRVEAEQFLNSEVEK
jgi:hypothetical protein